MSRERLIMIVATAGAIIVLCVLGFGGSSSKQTDFRGSLPTWASTVIRQNSKLKALSLGETSNFYAGVFKSESNVLFLGWSVRNHFIYESSGRFDLYDTNGRIVNYQVMGLLLYTNVVRKLSLRGLKTDSQGYCLGMYVKPDATVDEARFAGDTNSGPSVTAADLKVLRWDAN
jgi:hypothetical protein